MFITAKVSNSATAKVTRFFDGSLKVILNELLQNSRRAGANQVKLELIEEDEKGYILKFIDDGHGIKDPQILLNFGESGWESDAIAEEDPAGMGILSLADRGCVIESHDWHVVLKSINFQGEPSEVSSPSSRQDNPIEGTIIWFEISLDELNELNLIVEEAVKFYPVEVLYRGSTLLQENFLGDCEYIEQWNGLKIGIFESYVPRNRSKYQEAMYGHPALLKGQNANYHGQVIKTWLPVVSEVGSGVGISVKLEVIDCKHLKLVLPDRDGIVENDFWFELRNKCLEVIFRCVASKGSHSLPFLDFKAAEKLGINLPEAEPKLRYYCPELSDDTISRTHGTDTYKQVNFENADIVDLGHLDPWKQQLCWKVLNSGNPGLNEGYYQAEDSFKGYIWYDQISRITDYQLSICTNGGTYQYSSEEKQVEDLILDQILIKFNIEEPNKKFSVQYPAKFWFFNDDTYWANPDNIYILVNKEYKNHVSMAELMTSCFFCYSDEGYGRGIDEQRDLFFADAKNRTISLLETEEVAIAANIKSKLEQHDFKGELGGYKATIIVTRNGYEVIVEAE